MGSTTLRRLGTVVVVAVVVGAMVAGAVDDLRVELRLRHNESQLATTRAIVRRTAAAVTAATSARRRMDEVQKVTGQGLTVVTAEIASARQLLTGVTSGMASQDIELDDVRGCADGVRRSVAALRGGNQPTALSALSGVAPVCERMLGSGAGGPVYPFDFADPDVVVARGTYVAYGTNSTAGNIQIMESTDLEHWTKEGDALPTVAAWAVPGDTWAPAVIRLKRSYVLYYTAAMAGSKVPCLSVATAKRPEGPFTDSTTKPLECQAALGGSIDPAPFVDPGGQPSLLWKSNGGGGEPATIWAQSLDPSGTALEGPGPVALLRPSERWEGSVVEAPSMVTVDGSDFLFYSGNNWDSTDYAVGVARCAGVLGPCTKPLSGPLFGSQRNLVGPGGASVFTDTSGRLEMALAAWLPGAVGYPHARLLFVRPLVVFGGVPRVEPPG